MSQAREERANTILREFGFGIHETAVILALNKLTSGTVAELSSLTGIHHANLYSVLDGLVAKGLVIEHEGRPRVHEFSPLSHVRDLLATRVNHLIDDLRAIQAVRDTKKAKPTLIFTIRGKMDVETKVLSMISRARTRMLIVAPSMEVFSEEVRIAIEAAAQRGVAIRAILGEPLEEQSPPIQQRIKEDTLAIDIVIDGEEALISMPDLSVCGWAENILISQQLEGFLEQTWQIARTI
ncbi:MAG: TrmB family transcriptional regulator [Candidatus Hodarchaeota archaeon]